MSDVTIGRLIDTIHAGDVDGVKAMLASRPELARMHVSEGDEHQALHHAVLARQPEIVRILMQRGADPHAGIWPHRDATSPLTLARDRGDDAIVAIIRQEESRRAPQPRPAGEATEPRGAGDSPRPEEPDSPAWAIRTGNVEWLRERMREDRNRLAAMHLVSMAVSMRQPKMLAFLLKAGYDPDERHRPHHLEEPLDIWGGPLREAVILGDVTMARMLLEHGATPQTNVYAASSAIYEAYARRNDEMVTLLEHHGGKPEAGDMAYLGLTDRAEQALDEEARASQDGRASSAGVVLQAAADTGNVDLVRLALTHIDWKPGDSAWHWMLMRPLGRHSASERPHYEACLRALLERSGGKVRGPFGRTLLHDVAGAWPRSAPMDTDDRLGFANLLLEFGARIDVRDTILESTPLGWACRWRRPELVRLLLDRGADPVEADAEQWATPRAWAIKSGDRGILAMLGG